MDKVEVYALGALSCSVCAPESMTPEEIIAGTEKEYPCGTTAGWQISKSKTFKGGQPMPCPCEQTKGRQHWRLEA